MAWVSAPCGDRPGCGCFALVGRVLHLYEGHHSVAAGSSRRSAVIVALTNAAGGHRGISGSVRGWPGSSVFTGRSSRSRAGMPPDITDIDLHCRSGRWSASRRTRPYLPAPDARGNWMLPSRGAIYRHCRSRSWRSRPAHLRRGGAGSVVTNPRLAAPTRSRRCGRGRGYVAAGRMKPCRPRLLPGERDLATSVLGDPVLGHWFSATGNLAWFRRPGPGRTPAGAAQARIADDLDAADRRTSRISAGRGRPCDSPGHDGRRGPGRRSADGFSSSSCAARGCSSGSRTDESPVVSADRGATHYARARGRPGPRCSTLRYQLAESSRVTGARHPGAFRYLVCRLVGVFATPVGRGRLRDHGEDIVWVIASSARRRGVDRLGP